MNDRKEIKRWRSGNHTRNGSPAAQSLEEESRKLKKLLAGSILEASKLKKRSCDLYMRGPSRWTMSSLRSREGNPNP